VDNQTNKPGQPVIINLTTPQPRKSGIANVGSVLAFADIKSRTTLIKMEREGRFPKRIDLGAGRVGWRWDALYRWADNLQSVEGGE
jgi:predicted DNA-binding transcriptional regulator AlpA